jgi:hypothetical protein
MGGLIMARFTLTINFNDPLGDETNDDGDFYPALAASAAVAELKRTQIKVESCELVDNQASPKGRHIPDPEWCELEEGDYPEVFAT